MINTQANSNQKVVPLTKKIFSASVLKPLIGGIVCSLSDRFILKNDYLKSNILFGASVAAGIFVSSSIGLSLKNSFQTDTRIGKLNKNVESRIVEIIFGSSSAYIVNKFILKNDYSRQEIFYKLGIIAVSDLLAESASELFVHI